jgi:hypothetical protein
MKLRTFLTMEDVEILGCRQCEHKGDITESYYRFIILHECRHDCPNGDFQIVDSKVQTTREILTKISRFV